MDSKHTPVQYGQISTTQRIGRLALAAVLIGSGMANPAQFLVLALIAVYPMTSAIISVDPVYLMWEYARDHYQSYSLTARVALATVGAVLIGSAFVIDGALGWFALLPLLGVYPVLSAIMGTDPLWAVSQTGTGSQPAQATLYRFPSEAKSHTGVEPKKAA